LREDWRGCWEAPLLISSICLMKYPSSESTKTAAEFSMCGVNIVQVGYIRGRTHLLPPLSALPRPLYPWQASLCSLWLKMLVDREACGSATRTRLAQPAAGFYVTRPQKKYHQQLQSLTSTSYQFTIYLLVPNPFLFPSCNTLFTFYTYIYSHTYTHT